MSVILILGQSLVVFADWMPIGPVYDASYFYEDNTYSNEFRLCVYEQGLKSSTGLPSSEFWNYKTYSSDSEVVIYLITAWVDADGDYKYSTGVLSNSPISSKGRCVRNRSTDGFNVIEENQSFVYSPNGSYNTSTDAYAGYFLYSELKVFNSKASAQAYLDTGNLDGLVQDAIEPELTQNNFIGFNDFKARRTIDPYLFGGNGVLVTYTLPSNYEELLSDNAELMFDVTFTTQVKGSKLMSNVFVDNGYWNDKYTVQITEPITGSSGQITFDYMSLLLESGAYTGSDGLALTAVMYEADTQYDTGKFLGTNALTFADNKLGTNLADILESNEYIGLMSLECNIVAYIQDGYEVGKKSYGYVDLVDGANQSVTDVPDVMNEDDTVTENGSKSESNLNDMKKDTDSSGSPIYTEVTGSSNSNSSAEVVNNVIFPSDITVTVIGGSYGNSSDNPDYDITIEDDDYTDTELRNDLRDGFGMFDDVTTDKENDGFLNMLSGIFSMIDPELGDILTYGVSTAVVVSLLRLMFKR